MSCKKRPSQPHAMNYATPTKQQATGNGNGESGIREHGTRITDIVYLETQTNKSSLFNIF